ncbi:MAG: SIMPL domain-containing protein, partial [Treponema sp.]|nr:SIMPL domain-containing protein [Treponema sp.]
MKEHLKYIIPSLAGIIAALILAFGMKNITSPNRTVSVRGLSEREVDADMAVWKLSFTLGADSLPVLKE